MATSRKLALSFLWLAPLLWLGACQHRPIEEMALADVALKAAQKAKADSLATDQFRKAENNFLRAKRDFADGYYDSARKFAGQARLLAEQAEFKALQKSNALRGGGARSTNGEAGGEDLEEAFSETK